MSHRQFYFDHLLTQRAAYTALLGTNRALLHSVTARALEEQLRAGSPEEAAVPGMLIRHFWEAGDFEAAHHNACRMLGLLISLGRTADWGHYEKFAQDAWAAARRADPGLPSRSPVLLLRLGDQLRIRGDHARAAMQLLEARRLAAAMGNAILEAQVCNTLGVNARDQGQQETAEGWFRQALIPEVAPEFEAVALSNLASVYYSLDRLAESAAALNRALELALSIGILRQVGRIEGSRGVLFETTGDLQAAESCYRAELDAARQTGSLRGQCWALTHLASLADTRGEFVSALELLWQAQRLLPDLSDPVLEAYLLERLAEACLHSGNINQARHYARTALSHARQRSDVPREARLQKLLSELG